MDAKRRPSGIDGLGDMSWGTHFCLFYETQEDLLDILIPYFKAGLANHEFCLYVASEPVIAEEIERALHETAPGFEHYLSEGQIEIVSHMNWYLKDGHFNPLRVRQSWLDKLDQALGMGYAGMRLAANTTWLEKQDWDRFAEYEGKFDHEFRHSQIIGLCVYNLNLYSAANMLDVIRHHQFTLARRDGAWEPLEGVQLKSARDEVLKLNNELEQRVIERTAELATMNEQLKAEIRERMRVEEALRKSERVLREAEALGHTGSWEQDLVTGKIFNTEENLRLFFGDDRSEGENFEDYAQVVHPNDREYVMQRRAELLEEEGPGDIEYRVVWPDGSVHVIFGRATVVRNEFGQPIRVYGTNVDITERKRVEQQNQRLLHNLGERVKELTALHSWARILQGEEPNALKVLQEMVSLLPPAFQYSEMTVARIRLGQQEAMTPGFSDSISVLRTEFATADGQACSIEVGYTQDCPLEAEGPFLVEERNLINTLTEMLRSYLDHKRAEDETKHHASQMEALAEISQALAEVGLDVQAVFETIVRHTADLIGDTCSIRLLSSDEQWLKSVGFHHPNPEVKALMRVLHPRTPTPANNSWLTPVLRTGQPLLIPIITQEQLRRNVQPEYLQFFEQVGLHSMLIVPLRVKGRVIGTLGLSRDQPGHPYTSDDQVLLQDLADRASLTIQNAQLFQQVERARAQLGALSRRLLEVQESERRALTSELHDRVGQHLTGLSILLQNMKALLPNETAQRLETKFDDAQSLVEDTTRQIRDIMAELHLPELEDYGLAAALETYAERVASRGNLKLITDLPDLAPPPLPSDVRIALFRAAQEAISNVLKHAGATKLEISLQGENGRLRLRVEDDGQGFEPEAASQKDASSWGLQIMRERIESIGGNVQIESEPGQGTRITFEIESPS